MYASTIVCIEKLYDVFNGFYATKESKYKPKKTDTYKPAQRDGESDKDYEERLFEYEQKQRYKEGDTIHFYDPGFAFKACNKDKMLEAHPELLDAPQSVFTSKSGLVADMKRSFGNLPVEFQKPVYYSDRNKRTSYSYQECLSKITQSDNKNVLYITLAKVGKCKIRGWNDKIKFDADGHDNFVEYAAKNKSKAITVKVKKDNCGDYWICFTLLNVYKPVSCNSNKTVGIDVGVADLAILSDGTKYRNRRFKKIEEDRLSYLMTKQSKQQGWKNQEFVKAHRKNKDLQVSIGYQKTALKINKINRKVTWRRDNYNHNVTTDIVSKYYFIGIESLDVKGLMTKYDEEKTNAKNATTHYNLADAAMGDVLSKLKYKSEWHGRKIVAVGKYFASSKICNCCGYKMDSVTTDIREWVCPSCGSKNDRDVNAAKNIEMKALIDTYGENDGRKYYTDGYIDLAS